MSKIPEFAPTKNLPPEFLPAGNVSLKKPSDLQPMLVWSIVLLIVPVPLIYLILRSQADNSISFIIDSPFKILSILGGILLTTLVMLVVHEGLHGLVFWISTRESPKFSFKWYYASASAAGWYLPKNIFLLATLLPLVVITIMGLLLLPILSSQLRYLMILLILFNASGCAGDVLVAQRLLHLPIDTLTLDNGDEVFFYSRSG